MGIKIIVSTIKPDRGSLHVLAASVDAYAPEADLCVENGKGPTFGDDYNRAIERFMSKDDEGVIIANDDIVLTPYSLRLLMEDVQGLKKLCGAKLGLVAARSDYVRPSQNIRVPRDERDQFVGMRWKSEGAIKKNKVVSPLFAWLPRGAFEQVKFPPLNWFSDDVMCADLAALGFSHWISRSYIHHVGSMTIGVDMKSNLQQSLPWLRENRPDYIAQWGLE
jgi:hypothetical protein